MQLDLLPTAHSQRVEGEKALEPSIQTLDTRSALVDFPPVRYPLLLLDGLLVRRVRVDDRDGVVLPTDMRRPAVGRASVNA